MKLYDLSHCLSNESPVYPGNDSPEFLPAATIAAEGYRETHLSFDSHVGTHIDAPAHMLEDGKTLDRLPLEAFSGKAIIITIPGQTCFIEKKFLKTYRQALTQVDFVLFRTGWGNRWGSSEYFKDFPVLTPEAVEWLLAFPLKGIGFDAISADPVESTQWVNHFAIFKKGLIIIENLVFPDELKDSTGHFSCYPISFKNADGSPVRAVYENLNLL